MQDAMTWILNNKRGDVLVLSARQLMKFRTCNVKNYQRKRGILLGLGIIERKGGYEWNARMADEYRVLYAFDARTRTTRRGRKPSSQVNIADEVDRLILAGASNKEVRKQFPRSPDSESITAGNG